MRKNLKLNFIDGSSALIRLAEWNSTGGTPGYGEPNYVIDTCIRKGVMYVSNGEWRENSGERIYVMSAVKSIDVIDAAAPYNQKGQAA